MVEYRIFFSQSAERDLKKLPKDVRRRIMLVLSRARFDLKRYVKKLRDTSFFRLRVGDYRVILHLDDSDKSAYILKIAHRKNIYRL